MTMMFVEQPFALSGSAKDTQNMLPKEGVALPFCLLHPSLINAVGIFLSYNMATK